MISLILTRGKALKVSLEFKSGAKQGSGQMINSLLQKMAYYL